MTKDGPTTTPPDVMKRKLRNVLRQERERLNITQKVAAERVLWSQTKLIRMETGVTSPTPADVRLLLLGYGWEEEQIADVVKMAMAARERDTAWEAYRNKFSDASLSLYSNERAASAVLKYEPSLVPGLFQTEEYARALLRDLESRSEDSEIWVNARMQRQEMLESNVRPDLDFIIGEAAVSRPIGGLETMRAQIRRLKEIAKLEKTTLRLMPFSAGAHPGMGSAFTILEFRDDTIPDLLYLESIDRASVVQEDEEEVSRYNTRFAELRDLASPPEDFDAQLDEVCEYRFKTKS